MVEAYGWFKEALDSIKDTKEYKYAMAGLEDTSDHIDKEALGLASTPQPQPKQGVTEVLPHVVQALIDRVKVGTGKYGSPLMTMNGRKALVDAYQEALDLCMYLQQEILERESRQDPVNRHMAMLKAWEQWHDACNIVPPVSIGFERGFKAAWEKLTGLKAE